MGHWSEGYTPKPTTAKPAQTGAFVMQASEQAATHMAYWDDLNAETLTKTANDRTLANKIYRDRFGEDPKTPTAREAAPAPAAPAAPETAAPEAAPAAPEAAAPAAAPAKPAPPEPAPKPAPAPAPSAPESAGGGNTMLYAGIAVAVLIVLYLLLG